MPNVVKMIPCGLPIVTQHLRHPYAEEGLERGDPQISATEDSTVTGGCPVLFDAHISNLLTIYVVFERALLPRILWGRNQ